MVSYFVINIENLVSCFAANLFILHILRSKILRDMVAFAVPGLQPFGFFCSHELLSGSVLGVLL